MSAEPSQLELPCVTVEVVKPTTLTPKHRRLVISFSGGKTSAYMTWLLLTVYRHLWDEVIVIFANTGEEHPKTLEYVQACAEHYGWQVVWVEAKVDPRPRKATKHHEVKPAWASRKGQPFEAVLAKYGIPNQAFPHCTRELKERPMYSYLDYCAWFPGTYDMAIGLRFDEMDRISPKWMEKGVFYPLIDLHVTKADVLAWEVAQPVRLGIPEHLGNCVWCWKKSLRKLATVAQEMPEAFAFPQRTERQYHGFGAGGGDRRYFRGQRTTADIFVLARDPSFEPFVDDYKWQDDELDTGMACGDGCEVGVDGPEEVSATAA